MPRNQKKTRARGWILKNTRIGPVLDIKVCHHEYESTIEVPVKSLFLDRTASWDRIVNGVVKYVTESMLTKKEEDRVWRKPIATLRPRQNSTVTMTFVSIPVLERKWIDIETQRSHDHKCVVKCQKPSPDYYDMISQSLEEAAEQSTTATSLKNARRRRKRRRRSTTMLRNGYF